LGAGSVNRYVAGVTLRYSGSRWESRTSTLYASAQNRFLFTNNTREGKPRERQQHAAYSNRGFLQEFYKKAGATDEFSFHLWYMDFDRDVQPSVSNNDHPETWTTVYDKNFKFSAAYRGNANRFTYSVHTGYARDYEKYEKDIIEANRIMGAMEGVYNLKSFTVKGGVNTAYVSPTGKAFDGAVTEWRSDLYGLLLWRPASSLTANAGVRQSFVSNLGLSPDPFIGIEWIILQHRVHRLGLRGAFSKSHKIPTLNDRYWGGAHLYLRPERATTLESGIDYKAGAGNWRLEVSGTGYLSDVIDWIRWFPAGVVWRPQNIPVVAASGVEASVRLQSMIGLVQWGLHTHYAYTKVTSKKSLWDRDPGIGRQLAYQPYHCISANFTGSYRFLSWEVQSRYTGPRTTNDIHDVLPGYQLWNIHIAGTAIFSGRKCTLQLMVNNLFNKDYQNVKFYAMPGRNFMFNLQVQF